MALHAARRLSAVVVVLALLALPLALPATADPSAPVFPSADEVERSKRKVAGTATEVGRIEAQLAAAGARTDRLALEVGQAVEAYNGARVRLDQAEQDVVTAQRVADEARAAVETSRDALGRFAAAAYRSGGDVGSLSAFLVAGSPRDLISRVNALQSIGNSQRHALEEFRAAQAHASVLELRAEDLVAQRREAARQVAQAKAAAETRLAGQQQAVAQIATQRESLVRALAAARHTSVRLESARQDGLERQRAEAARRAAEARAREQARQAEAARQAEVARHAEAARKAEEAAEAKRRAEDAAAEARRAQESQPAPGNGGGSSGGGGGPSEPAPAPAPPPPSGSSSGTASGADRAIDFARAQIGKPYQWAAAGPGSYDCSGLTMRAWEQGGVGLPHYSVAQYESSEVVPVSGLRPGDLVFFASDPNDHRSIYHVGLYIGDGQMIEAPYTGENVRVSSIWRGSLFGAARP